MYRGHVLIFPLILVVVLAACAPNTADQPTGMMAPGMRMDPGMMQRHMAPIPDEYADRTNPIVSDAESLARGKEIYETNCAVCHGAAGWGDGPAAANLEPPPAPIAHTGQMLSDAYLFYRISEGGDFAPFNSAMPAWKDQLSESGRWDVINYIRSLRSNGMMNGGGMMVDGGTWWMMGPWWFLGWVLIIGIVAVIVFAVVWAVRRGGRSSQNTETPLDILKRRYARGEISAEQFEAMKRQLSEH